MDTAPPTLTEDLKRAGEQSRLSLWGGIIAALVSFIAVPIVGLAAAYFGYRLMGIMHRTWFGIFLAVFGIVNALLWFYAVAFAPELLPTSIVVEITPVGNGLV